MASRLSFSTQENTAKVLSCRPPVAGGEGGGSISLPSSYELAVAKRRLCNFVESEILAKAYEREPLLVSPPPLSASSLDLIRLPIEILNQAMKYMDPEAIFALGATCKFVYVLSCAPENWIHHMNPLASAFHLSGIHHSSSNHKNARNFCLALAIPSPHLFQAFDIIQSLQQEIENSKEAPADARRGAKNPYLQFHHKETLELIYERLGVSDGPWTVSVKEQLERDLSAFSQEAESSKVDLFWSFLGDTCLCLHLRVKQGFYSYEGLLSFHVHFSQDNFVPPTVYSLSSTLYHPCINNKGEVSLLHRGGKGLVLALVRFFVNADYLTSHFDL